jgi:hypothetical protein
MIPPYLKSLAATVRDLLPRFKGTEPGVLQSHQGTREGARAAWGFVVESLQHRLRLRVADLDAQTFRGQAPIPLDDSRVAICDRHRRELEAM